MTKVKPRLIALKINGSGNTDRSDEVSKAVIAAAASESDFVTFAAARSGGGRDYVLNMTIAQDHASGTLWDLIWTGAGTEVDGTYAPYGNAVATVSQPLYNFTAIVSEPDGDLMGGEATTSTSAVAVVEVSWSLKAKPTKVTTA